MSTELIDKITEAPEDITPAKIHYGIGLDALCGYRGKEKVPNIFPVNCEECKRLMMGFK